MKNRKICWRGCPEEQETHYQCIAYKNDGRLCKKPATVLDPQRGGFICERHHAQLMASLTLEVTGAQAA